MVQEVAREVDEHPPARTDHRKRGNLPRPPNRLIGRDRELTTIGEALNAGPIVTLVGPGGIGKTRLAVAVARTVHVVHGGAVWLVELSGIDSSDDVGPAIVDTLGSHQVGTETAAETIVAALRGRPVLVVLDNCEHVVQGAAEIAQSITEGCADISILATSREGLGLKVEQLTAVAPLEPTGPGVELFTERAVAADRAFAVEQWQSEITQICRRLDGVPLAIELAASRTRSLAPPDLLAHLDDHLRLLTGGRRASVERHRTLRAAIQWSYELLSPLEQSLFQRLSIFLGPFDLAAAESVASVGDGRFDVDGLLDGLVDCSMVIADSGPFGRRFRLLETIRHFAAERLFETGDAETIAERHARWRRVY